MRRSVIVGGLCIAGAVAAAAAYGSRTDSDSREASSYRIQKVERGAIVKSVTAAGKLNAVVTVKVGSQISGRVSELFADFNSEVRKDQVIARIDPTTFEARVNEAQADLEVARAQVAAKEAAVAQAQANVANARATLTSAEADLAKAQITAADLERDFKRLSELRASGAAAASAVDKARAVWQAAEAQVNVARAQIAAQRSQVGAREAAVVMAEADVGHGRAQIEQKAAVLKTAMVNLDNSVIRSPVDGVVIGRDVDVGTVVAASLQAPTLFSIAQDLHEMQVEAAIDEADIGQIVPGQEAVFTVDSFLGQEFHGRVTQVRKQPLDVMNVITYTVVVRTENPDLRLLPGMTANIEIRVSNRSGVLRVPSAALRFRPPESMGEPAGAGAAPKGETKGKGPGAEAQRAQFEEFAKALDLDEEQAKKIRALNAEAFQQTRALRQAEAKAAAAPNRGQAAKLRDQVDEKIMTLLRPEQQEKFRLLVADRRTLPAMPARVWVLEDGKPKAVAISVGVSDNSFTELVRGPLAEGAEVIIGINREAQARGSGRLPKLGF
jgi:HlyD family secretion protein